MKPSAWVCHRVSQKIVVRLEVRNQLKREKFRSRFGEKMQLIHEILLLVNSRLTSDGTKRKKVSCPAQKKCERPKRAPSSAEKDLFVLPISCSDEKGLKDTGTFFLFLFFFFFFFFLLVQHLTFTNVSAVLFAHESVNNLHPLPPLIWQSSLHTPLVWWYLQEEKIIACYHTT